MIFDQYIKLFSTDWIEPWMVEALAIMFGALLLVLIIGKTMDFLNGDQQ
jgi:hypothetical protein